MLHYTSFCLIIYTKRQNTVTTTITFTGELPTKKKNISKDNINFLKFTNTIPFVFEFNVTISNRKGTMGKPQARIFPNFLRFLTQKWKNRDIHPCDNVILSFLVLNPLLDFPIKLVNINIAVLELQQHLGRQRGVLFKIRYERGHKYPRCIIRFIADFLTVNTVYTALQHRVINGAKNIVQQILINEGVVRNDIPPGILALGGIVNLDTILVK